MSLRALCLSTKKSGGCPLLRPPSATNKSILAQGWGDCKQPPFWAKKSASAYVLVECERTNLERLSFGNSSWMRLCFVEPLSAGNSRWMRLSYIGQLSLGELVEDPIFLCRAGARGDDLRTLCQRPPHKALRCHPRPTHPLRKAPGPIAGSHSPLKRLAI